MNGNTYVNSHLQSQHIPSTTNMGLPGEKPKKSLEARMPAWEVLEAQSPETLECQHCKKHHPLSDIQMFVPSKNLPFSPTPCMKLDQKYRTAKFIHPDFNFTVFRMVMKQDRLGGDRTELLKFLSYRSGVLMDGSQVKQYIATPKIIAGRLLMRVQTAYVIPSERESRLYLANKNHLKCPHSHTLSYHNRSMALSIVNKLVALETLPKGRQEIVYGAECKICFTRFQAGLQRFEEEGVMLFITKWQDLGTGFSPLKCDIPHVIGPPRCVPWEGMGQRSLSGMLKFEGQDLDSSSALTATERAAQFRRGESKNAQKKRARETLYWKLWGRQNLFPHQLTGERI